MNIKLLEKVKQRILEHPNRFVMREWIITKEALGKSFKADGGQEIAFDNCGTAGCIAGWACLIQTRGKARTNSVNADLEARDYLEFSEEQAEELFYMGGWPIKFSNDYLKAKTQEERARIAAARIDHFIAQYQEKENA
jgi:hypothetical protein